ncbi:MAG TPA: hypothetical protein VLD60_02480, partial [Nitrospira sp.]|nr:hypothetical protein [Nitrospira sp.]
AGTGPLAVCPRPIFYPGTAGLIPNVRASNELRQTQLVRPGAIITDPGDGIKPMCRAALHEHKGLALPALFKPFIRV